MIILTNISTGGEFLQKPSRSLTLKQKLMLTANLLKSVSHILTGPTKLEICTLKTSDGKETARLLYSA